MQEVTEEMKIIDREEGRKAYVSNQTKGYMIKNRGLDIKIGAMEIVSKRMEEIDKKIDSQKGIKKLLSLAVIAELGRAIIPD